ncbi:hypothetical protein CS022_17080 [Veronia nyctiphanis]|uniref:DUF1521 domain-containing protein n=1 Tax=Veronia nyctiphanis TaxID=1278244 RepID=A0A4V1LSM9_9GAMM|nr:DUF1521 domain-containing protein [Veronia nyctiphanis]RXJ72258.1 hypothetical protein CS022_17080 [Veronia nyctiphanis]
MSYGYNQNPMMGGYGLHQSQNLFKAYYGDCSTVEKTDGTGNQSDKVAWENDNYTITFDDNNASMKIVNKHTGEIYKVSGDPHLFIGDQDEPGSMKHVGDFYNDGVITLDDGTQIHMNTEESKTGKWAGMTLLDTVTIVEPCCNKATQISGLDMDSKQDLEVKEGSIHEILGWNGKGTGVDYETALCFHEAFGEEEGLYLLGADGKPNLITNDDEKATINALIKEIEDKLNESGYGHVAPIWGGVKPEQMQQFCEYLMQMMFQQICTMFGNSAGVMPGGGLPGGGLPGGGFPGGGIGTNPFPCDHSFYQQLLQLCGPQIPPYEQFNNSHLMGLGLGAQVFLQGQQFLQLLGNHGGGNCRPNICNFGYPGFSMTMGAPQNWGGPNGATHNLPW